MPRVQGRKVSIDDNLKKKGRGRQQRRPEPEDLGLVQPSYLQKRMSPPTGQIRHMPKIREGKISFEVFAKSRLATISVDHDVRAERERLTNASEKQKAAKVGIRGEGSGVGAAAPLRQQEDPAQAQEEQAAVASARERKRQR